MPQLQAKKSLGQHFLADENILRRIAEASDIRQSEQVVEIGPGTGLLTKHLLDRPLSKLTAFELDERAIDLLQNHFTDERFSVIHKDFLQVTLNELVPSDPLLPSKLNVIGNIPYYITTPIIFKLFDDRADIRCATLLMQLEVAERLIGKPRTKEYGIPSVITQCLSDVKLLFKVKAGAFRPAPKVDSAVVRFDFENDFFQRSGSLAPTGFEEKKFSKMVRTLFAMRRKTIRNNLKQLSDAKTESELLVDFLPKRAEELSIEEFLRLYSILY